MEGAESASHEYTHRERERGRAVQRFLPASKQSGLQIIIVTVRGNLKMLEPWSVVGGETWGHK